MSETLTPANAALMKEDCLNQLRLLQHRSLTPRAHDILQSLGWYMDELVQAEEYGHPVLSQEEAIKRAQRDVDLCMKALKQSVITSVKCRKGDWVAVA